MTANKLYVQACETYSAIIASDYPKNRKMRAMRAAMRRRIRRHNALLAERDAALGWIGNGRAWERAYTR